MITVRLLGLLSTYGGPRTFSIQAQTALEVINMLSDMGVDKDLLKGAIVFVNQTPIHGLKLRSHLKNGDEIALISPVGGG